MSEDKLKNWINSERDSFESEEPSKAVWERVEHQLQKPKQGIAFPNLKRWSIAASIAVLLGVAALYVGSGPEHPISAENPETLSIDLVEMGGDLAEVGMYYSSQVNLKTAELSAYEIDEEFLEEMAYLKDEFEALKEDMGQGMDDGKVVEAMIDNYRLRLALLEDLLEAVSIPTAQIKAEEHEL